MNIRPGPDLKKKYVRKGNWSQFAPSVIRFDAHTQPLQVNGVFVLTFTHQTSVSFDRINPAPRYI